MKKIIIASMATLALATTSMATDVNAKTCVACHGADWTKKALGKSKDVSSMTHEEIASSLIGYKDGTYGGPMKNVMISLVKKHSNEELEAFSSTIGK